MFSKRATFTALCDPARPVLLGIIATSNPAPNAPRPTAVVEVYRIEAPAQRWRWVVSPTHPEGPVMVPLHPVGEAAAFLAGCGNGGVWVRGEVVKAAREAVSRQARIVGVVEGGGQ